MLNIILSFLGIGLGAMGGGLVTISLIYHEVVEHQNWLSPKELKKAITLSQMTPGPVAINTATYTGYQLEGIGGAVLATAAVILPGILIISTLVLVGDWLMEKSPGLLDAKKKKRLLHSLRPAILGLLLYAGYSFGLSAYSGFIWLAIAAAALAFYVFLPKVHPVIVILACGVLGIFLL